MQGMSELERPGLNWEAVNVKHPIETDLREFNVFARLRFCKYFEVWEWPHMSRWQESML